MSCESIIPVAYRTTEVAKFFNVSPRTVTQWVHAGILPGKVVGGTVMVWRPAVDRLIEEAKQAA